MERWFISAAYRYYHSPWNRWGASTGDRKHQQWSIRLEYSVHKSNTITHYRVYRVYYLRLLCAHYSCTWKKPEDMIDERVFFRARPNIAHSIIISQWPSSYAISHPWDTMSGILPCQIFCHIFTTGYLIFYCDLGTGISPWIYCNNAACEIPCNILQYTFLVLFPEHCSGETFVQRGEFHLRNDLYARVHVINT